MIITHGIEIDKYRRMRAKDEEEVRSLVKILGGLWQRGREQRSKITRLTERTRERTA